MQVEVFAALADPTRLAIVEALRRGEQQVNDLVERMPIHQSGVSRHLRILSSAGLVRMRPDGARRLYSLEGTTFAALEEWVSKFHATWDARLDRFGAELERRKRSRDKKGTR